MAEDRLRMLDSALGHSKEAAPSFTPALPSFTEASWRPCGKLSTPAPSGTGPSS